MPANDIYQCVIEFELQNNPNAYDYYLRVTTVNDEENIYQGVLAFGAARITAMQALHSVDVTFRCVVSRQVWPTKSIPRVQASGVAGNRTSATPITLPGQCSAVVTLYGDRVDPDRWNRGRDFWTGALASDQANGVWNTGVASYLQDLCDYYQTMTNAFTDAWGNVYEIGLFSRTRAGVVEGTPPVAVPFFWPLNFVIGKSLVRTQRRRQPEDPCEVTCEAPIGSAPL